MRLQGKAALITGAGSGIGEASAKLFVTEGARVAVADINREAAARVVSEIRAAGGEPVRGPRHDRVEERGDYQHVLVHRGDWIGPAGPR